MLVSNCFPDPDICSIAIKAKKSGINYFYIYKLLTIFSEIKPRTFIYLKLQKFFEFSRTSFHFLKSFTIQCVDNTILSHAQILFLTNLGLK